MLHCHIEDVGKLEMDFKLVTGKTYNNPLLPTYWFNLKSKILSNKELPNINTGKKLTTSNALIMKGKLLLNIKIIYQVGVKYIKLVKNW